MRATKKYSTLPYDPTLKPRARALRKAGMLHEVLLWKQLKAGRLHGLDFDRQKIIGSYIVDFYCAEKEVVIEIDGLSHEWKQDYDERRQLFLESLGLTVIRVAVAAVLRNLEGVLIFLRDHPAFSLSLEDEPTGSQ